MTAIPIEQSSQSMIWINTLEIWLIRRGLVRVRIALTLLIKIKEGRYVDVHLLDKRFDAHGKSRGEFPLYNNEVVTCDGRIHVSADDDLRSQSLQGIYGTP